MFAINKSSHFRSASIDAKLHLKNINLLLLVCQLGLHCNTKRTIAVNVFSTYRNPICLSSQSYIAAIIASIGTHAVCTFIELLKTYDLHFFSNLQHYARPWIKSGLCLRTFDCNNIFKIGFPNNGLIHRRYFYMEIPPKANFICRANWVSEKYKHTTKPLGFFDLPG